MKTCSGGLTGPGGIGINVGAAPCVVWAPEDTGANTPGGGTAVVGGCCGMEHN